MTCVWTDTPPYSSNQLITIWDSVDNKMMMCRSTYSYVCPDDVFQRMATLLIFSFQFSDKFTIVLFGFLHRFDCALPICECHPVVILDEIPLYQPADSDPFIGLILLLDILRGGFLLFLPSPPR